MSESSPGSFNDFTSKEGLDPATPEAVEVYTEALGENYHLIHAGEPVPVLSLVGALVIPVNEQAVA
ncbi:MAG: hypothetical protein NTX11_00995 [Candidatus Saccharibacteria bacterium]|nr:hypothetical protein [Candidatus Saccharibacteria bacterium]